MMTFNSSKRSVSGVTLIELVITIVLISIAIAGVVGGFSLVVGRSADTLFQSRTTAIGQAYLDDIMARDFDRTTPNGGVPPTDECNKSDSATDPNSGDRPALTAVEQFDGLDDQPPRRIDDDGDNTDWPGYDGYRVTVDVECAGSEVGLSNNGDAKRIDVTVTPPQGPEMVFTAYRGNF